MTTPSDVVSRPDWRDTIRVASDVALLGILVTMAALPVVTAGAAVATGSMAMHHYLEHDRWPTVRTMWAVFRRALLPGLLAVAGCAVTAVLLAIDVRAVRSDAVPGGTPLLVITTVLALAAVGFAALLVVAVGAYGGRDWRGALRAATATSGSRPGALAGAAGIVALAGLLAALVHPVLAPVLAGYTLFALHTVARRPGRTAVPSP